MQRRGAPPSAAPAGSALALLRSPLRSRGGGGGAAGAASPGGASPGGFGAVGSATSRTTGGSERPLCAFDVGGRCRHAQATRACFDCRRFDVTGTGLHCEACFAQRHPWTRVAHSFVFVRQRPPTPEKAPVVNLLAERTVREARALLDKTVADTALLGAPLAAARPALAGGAATLDALLARVAGSLLQLRNTDWQARQLAVRRIISLWRGRNLRRWWRTASRLLWGRMRDPDSGDDFFVNIATLRTSWDVPRVFGRVLPPDAFRRVFACSLSKQAAVSAIQRTARRFFARLKVASRLADAWRLVRLTPFEAKKLRPRRTKLPEGHPLEHFYYYNIENFRKTRDRPFILFTKVPKVFGEHEADARVVKGAVRLQSIVRRLRGRSRFVTELRDQWERVEDPLWKRSFYVNKKTGASQWKLPMAGIIKRDVAIPTAAEYNVIIDHREMEIAARLLVRCMRLVAGRRKAGRVLVEKSPWVRAWDADYKRYFYSNSNTGDSSWTKPAIFRRLGVDARVVGEPGPSA